MWFDPTHDLKLIFDDYSKLSIPQHTCIELMYQSIKCINQLHAIAIFRLETFTKDIKQNLKYVGGHPWNCLTNVQNETLADST